MYRRTEGMKELRLETSPLIDHFNHPDILQLRQDSNNNIKNPGCIRCWQEEDAGRKSKRLRDNDQYNNLNGLAYLELNLGNQCNLRCRTCGPHASSQWAKEYYDIYYSHVPYDKYTNELRKFYKSYEDDSPFWTDLENNLPTIRKLDFYGGEPFMSKKMWRILEVAVEKGYAKDIELNYATNGSFWPREVEYFKHFKHVSISFSIDGIDKQFEFMRYLADWSTVRHNMKQADEFSKAYPNVVVGWCITLSNLNIYYLPEIIEEYYKNYSHFGCYLNLVHSPSHFNINIMPNAVKSIVIDKLNSISKEYKHVWSQLPGIINFITNGNPDQDTWNNFLNEINAHDNYREQNYANIFPEFANIIGYKHEQLLDYTRIKAISY
jgi:MoaA/NifB/PqqE/SkfB family radical SAM enzyme